jgi:HD-GYP domain-containing protein (c-di-GMP phosphodiesterase class II)
VMGFTMVGADAPLLIYQSTQDHPLPLLARQSGWRVESADSVAPAEAALAAVCVACSDSEARTLRALCPDSICIGTSGALDGVDVCVPVNATSGTLARLLAHAGRVAELHRATRRDVLDSAMRRARTHQLTDIGIALSAQRDPVKLLEILLTQARELADCDAGSLYLIEETAGVRSLHFKLAQNDTASVPFKEARLPLTTDSLSGYVALTGNELAIADAYQIDASEPYSFNRSFDEQVGYRTQSLLVLPMCDHKGRVIGVLQFINCRNRTRDGVTFVPFDAEVTDLLRAVASQAAVAIQKNDLLRQISQLFESFVQASVKAIEQRDPSTSGHSFRVAETTTALLEALPRSGLARFRDLSVSTEQLTEVRYAALLHDFGKVGVRENVLVKANKLTDARLEVLRYRFELQKERLRRIAVERELAVLHSDPVEFDLARRRIKQELSRDLSRLDDYFTAITLANNPNVLAEGEFGHLEAIRQMEFGEFDGTTGHLITDHDLLALSVRRGSLTPPERREIEAHVSHTREFLAVLPWPPELSRVPLIAGAHHEKLDGSGYPDGRRGDEIPLPSKVMTVCDIFDALTSMDRPYKPAVSVDTAFRILNEEAAAGLIDTDIVGVFNESGSYLKGRFSGGGAHASARHHNHAVRTPH